MKYVYVYWTDTEGSHYTSSGLIAMKYFGAVESNTNLKSTSYGIQIFNSDHNYLPPTDIKNNIIRFIDLAKANPNAMFIFGPTPVLLDVCKALLFVPDNVVLDLKVSWLLEQNIF
jgi:hypothetical protein